MRLTIKNQFFSFGGGSIVTNEMGEEVFKVKGKVFSFTSKKFITDLAGNVLYTVRNKFWNFIHYHVFIDDANGNRIAKLSTTFSFVTHIVSKGFNDEYEVCSDVQNFRVNILRNGEIIAYYKSASLFIDIYEVEVLNPRDAALVTAIIICIDNIRDQRRNRAD